MKKIKGMKIIYDDESTEDISSLKVEDLPEVGSIITISVEPFTHSYEELKSMIKELIDLLDPERTRGYRIIVNTGGMQVEVTGG